MMLTEFEVSYLLIMRQVITEHAGESGEQSSVGARMETQSSKQQLQVTNQFF